MHSTPQRPFPFSHPVSYWAGHAADERVGRRALLRALRSLYIIPPMARTVRYSQRPLPLVYSTASASASTDKHAQEAEARATYQAEKTHMPISERSNPSATSLSACPQDTFGLFLERLDPSGH
eukprot:85991-Prorocentrum_minimum.AAC.2